MNERLRERAAVWGLGTLATGVGLVLGAVVVRLVAGPHASGWWPVIWIVVIAVAVAIVAGIAAGLLSEATITRWASRTRWRRRPDSTT